jgi:hypothetical protein
MEWSSLLPGLKFSAAAAIKSGGSFLVVTFGFFIYIRPLEVDLTLTRLLNFQLNRASKEEIQMDTIAEGNDCDESDL